MRSVVRVSLVLSVLLVPGLALAQGARDGRVSSDRGERVGSALRTTDALHAIVDDLHTQYPAVTWEAVLAGLNRNKTLERVLEDLNVPTLVAESEAGRNENAGAQPTFFARGTSSSAPCRAPHRDAKGEYEALAEFNTSVSHSATSSVPWSGSMAFGPRWSAEVDPTVFDSIVDDTGIRQSGVGDIQASVIGVAAFEGRERPKVTGSYEIKAPTASSTKELGSGQVDHDVNLELQKGLGCQRAFVVTAGLTQEWDGAESGFDAVTSVYGKAKYLLDDARRFDLQTKWAVVRAGGTSTVKITNILEIGLNNRAADTTYTSQIGLKTSLTDAGTHWTLLARLIIDGAIKLNPPKPVR